VSSPAHPAGCWSTSRIALLATPHCLLCLQPGEYNPCKCNLLPPRSLAVGSLRHRQGSKGKPAAGLVAHCLAPPTPPCPALPTPRSYGWLDNDTVVATVVPQGHGPPPQRPPVPPGPRIQDNSSGKKAQNRTFPDLLKVRACRTLTLPGNGPGTAGWIWLWSGACVLVQIPAYYSIVLCTSFQPCG
jgi:hypothetical protein